MHGSGKGTVFAGRRTSVGWPVGRVHTDLVVSYRLNTKYGNCHEVSLPAVAQSLPKGKHATYVVVCCVRLE